MSSILRFLPFSYVKYFFALNLSYVKYLGAVSYVKYLASLSYVKYLVDFELRQDFGVFFETVVLRCC